MMLKYDGGGDADDDDCYMPLVYYIDVDESSQEGLDIRHAYQEIRRSPEAHREAVRGNVAALEGLLLSSEARRGSYSGGSGGDECRQGGPEEASRE